MKHNKLPPLFQPLSSSYWHLTSKHSAQGNDLWPGGAQRRRKTLMKSAFQMVTVWRPRETLVLETHRPKRINNGMQCCRRGKCSPYVILVWQVIFNLFQSRLCVWGVVIYAQLPSLLGFLLWFSPMAEPGEGSKQEMRWFENHMKNLDMLGKEKGTEREKKWKKMKKKENFPSWSS